MKTIKDWLKELEEPYRTQALENADINKLQLLEPSLKDALSAAFVWDDSPQKHPYWNQLFYTL